MPMEVPINWRHILSEFHSIAREKGVKDGVEQNGSFFLEAINSDIYKVSIHLEPYRATLDFHPLHCGKGKWLTRSFDPHNIGGLSSMYESCRTCLYNKDKKKMRYFV